MKRIILVVLSAALPFLASAQAKVFWGNCDTRYSVEPGALISTTGVSSASAWKGERVNFQLVVSNKGEAEEFSYSFSDLKGPGGRRISSNNISGGFVQPVVSDEFSGCSRHDVEAHGKILVADRITADNPTHFDKGDSRGLWFTLWIPSDVPAGKYSGTVSVNAGGRIFKSKYSVNVINRVLPAPDEWSFFLDLWQNPYAVARVWNLKPWSEEHFEALRPYMTKLASCGQKAVTATLINRPWDGQTYDAFGSMVTWIKKIDGSWWYDFTIFDKWVDFMAQCGIDKAINCFSMLPWSMTFRYYDQATGENVDLQCEVTSPEYEEFWGGMLKAFASHLKEKGYFEKTYIAMDERDDEQMACALGIIRKYAPGMKVSLAGNYHESIEREISNYCLGMKDAHFFTPEIVSQRREAGMVSTYYVCCHERHPNVFTFSEPSDAQMIPLLSLKYGLDGFLRWAYNSWTEDAESDARYITWSAGDTHIIYPFSLSSIRWERLVQGVQNYEKWQILMKEAGDNVARQQRLKAILDIIDPDKLDGGCDAMVDAFSKALNR